MPVRLLSPTSLSPDVSVAVWANTAVFDQHNRQESIPKNIDRRRMRCSQTVVKALCYLSASFSGTLHCKPSAQPIPARIFAELPMPPDTSDPSFRDLHTSAAGEPLAHLKRSDVVGPSGRNQRDPSRPTPRSLNCLARRGRGP